MFNTNYDVGLGALDQPLMVDVVDDSMILAFRFFRDYTVEILWVRFPIDLIPIPMGDTIMTVGMNCAS